MAEVAGQLAAALRERFRAIPEGRRADNQAFSVRVWRGLSWLERSETAGDIEGKLISLWISFNAIYGYLDDDGLMSSAVHFQKPAYYNRCSTVHSYSKARLLMNSESSVSLAPSQEVRIPITPFCKARLRYNKCALRRYIRR